MITTRPMLIIGLKDDIKYIEEGSKYAKIIVIKPKIKLNSVEVGGFHDRLKFNSSGFYFINSINDYKFQIDQIVILLNELKDYTPSFCTKDEKFVIYLIGENLEESEFDIKENIKKGYKKLYTKLKERTDLFKGVWFDESSLYLSATLIGKDEDKISNTLASLCYPLADKHSGYIWMKDEKHDEDLEDIVDDISALGLHIDFKGSGDYKYTFRLVEWN